MKSMQPPLVAIFFMTYFHSAGGGHGPLTPPDPLLDDVAGRKLDIVYKWLWEDLCIGRYMYDDLSVLKTVPTTL